ncbi:heparinase II/III family protein [Paenibacillus sp. TAF58]
MLAGGSLFDCLELLYLASNGRIEIYNQSLIKHLGQFVSKTFIDDAYYANFVDGSAEPILDYALIYRYGKRIKDDAMISVGLHGFKQYNLENKSSRFLFLFREIVGLFASCEMEQQKEGEALYIREAWLPDIQVMTAREEIGSSRGFYLEAKGGHNQESHNHNDIGHFVVYYNGKPFLIDTGVDKYTAKTFSPQRYEIWTMQSDYHNQMGAVQRHAQLLKEKSLFIMS